MKLAPIAVVPWIVLGFGEKRLTLTVLGDGHVHIEYSSGEGGYFSEAELHDDIAKFVSERL